MMYVSNDPQDTHTHSPKFYAPSSTSEHEELTVVLANSGHDHLRNFAFSFRSSRAFRTRSLQAPRSSTFCLRQRDVFQKGCAHSSMENPLLLRESQQRLGAGPAILESRTGSVRRRSGLRVDHKAQTTLHTCILDSSL